MEQEVIDRIRKTLADHPILLFMKGSPDFPMCGFSAQSVAALRALGAEFDHVNILQEPELREALKVFSSWPTFPQLYVKGELIGGCDITVEMYNTGELKQVIEKAVAG
ncbi:MAG: Grx4 family monothiol glutaredoxin [Gammaproteobacteria bacterium]|nr:Grx4 family monothiol glutaredoxin [Gammaproteobacteria bacterium]